MFHTQRRFTNISCPDLAKPTGCTRVYCLFAHNPITSAQASEAVLLLRQLAPPVASSRDASKSTTQGEIPGAKSAGTSHKRIADGQTPTPSSSFPRSTVQPPPPKVQKVQGGSTVVNSAVARKPTTAIPTTATGAPKIQATIAESAIPIKTRQQMLNTIYDTFQTLYINISSTSPSLAAQHALEQEREVYGKSSKLTYRNGIITAITSIKRRPPPDSKHHPSVGTNAMVAARVVSATEAKAFRLERSHLQRALLSRDDRIKWEYVVDIPDGVGGDRPNHVGQFVTCERCKKEVIIKEDPNPNECTFHWMRAYTTKIDGVRETAYRCCSQSSGAPGCETGVHVFYEKNPADLHARHPFTHTSSTFAETSSSLATPPSSAKGKGKEVQPASTVLDVCAVDCEMVYTTAGMSVARVSVVDGMGDCVFDHLCRMSEGVQVLDLNTRFSGITSLDEAVWDLKQLRAALGKYIGPETIIIGHALENDLKTLRMIHEHVVDTVALYPHKAGAPYRRALRDVARDVLGTIIQTGGGTTGHSSVEDARATLDLVRAWVIQTQNITNPV